jgi:hypothetical protein
MGETESLMRLREISSHEKAVVFIHGIGAKDPQEYWKQFTTVLLQDTNTFIRDFDVYVWGYPTHKGPKWLIDFIRSLSNKTLVDATPAIVRLGGLWRSTYQTQFSAYQDIGLVCHSMGGLLVQSWVADVLEDGKSPELDPLRHIAFYSTPHNGAPIAGVAWNDQLEGMTVTGDFVGRTRRRWHDHVVKWKNIQMRPEDRLYNRYIPHLVLSGVSDQVVPRNFAEVLGMPCGDIQGNHTTLIQPTDIEDTRYKIWRNDLEMDLSSNKAVVNGSIQNLHQEVGREHAVGIQELNTSDSSASLSRSIISSSPMGKRNVLDQTLHSELVSVLEGIPATASFEGRTTLLQGLPRNIVLSLDRYKDNDTNDLENLLTQLDELGPLDTGEQPLIIFTQNALRRARGLAAHAALHKLLEELKRRYS